MLRSFVETDLRQIEEIHKRFHAQGFTLPSIAEAYANAVVERDGKILGFGLIRDITESIMILDLSLSLKEKKEILTRLIQESIRKSHHNIIHSFVENKNFTEVLKKHYGYRDCKGDAICLEI